MLRLLALLPRGSAFVSIYESGSKDRTGARPGVLRRLNPTSLPPAQSQWSP